jgi:MFS family permease
MLVQFLAHHRVEPDGRRVWTFDAQGITFWALGRRCTKGCGMASGVELGRIETDIPARMDRLPWARWHWLIVIGLGTVWILDGLEVTIVGSMSDALKSEDTGLGLSSSQVGLAGAVYVAGACLGALFFGQLTDRFGRKKLFMLTLGVYIVATVLTAFSMNPLWYFAARFLTGAGIGGEYAAINSAIDELIPADYRGRVDVAINGSFWIGAAGGALLTIPLLDPTVVDQALGWRLAFGLGAILGVGVLLVRRYVPESPRWLFIHGREDEGERIVRQIEETITEETGKKLPAVSERITIRQRKSIGIGLIAKTVFTTYPRRTLLCFALFVGQAFLYNAFFFTYGDTLSTFFDVDKTGYYVAIFAASNFIGALALSPLFDSIGRVRMIAGTYIVSGVLLGVASFFLGSLTAVTLTLCGAIVFFFASAGASAAYLTASEVFPMETRALCIAFFYAIGTAAGGITGPLLFGRLIENASGSGDITGIAIGYFLGAALMIVGGIAEAFLGVKAEGQSLEAIAKPLTAEDDGPDAEAKAQPVTT